MWETIGAVVPLGIGAAISPMPIIAAIALLFGEGARRNALAFLAASIFATSTLTLLAGLLASSVPEGGGKHLVLGLVKVGLGAAMLVLGARFWARRPRGGAEAPVPGWIAQLERADVWRAVLYGLLLTVLNTKNIPLEAAVGVQLSAGGSWATGLVAGGVFVLLASGLLIAIVFAALLFPARVAGPLRELRETLVAHNSVILAVVFALTGASIIGHGVAAF